MTKKEKPTYNTKCRTDVADAFNALTSEQMLQLKRYAKKKEKSVFPVYSWDDLIQEVFAFSYGAGGSGNKYKNWDKDKCDLLLFFKRGIDNIVDHYLRKFNNIDPVKEVVVDEGNSDKIGLAISEQGNDLLKDPEQINIKEEKLSEFYEYLDVLNKKDNNVGKVIECYLDGIWQPRKSSELTGLSIQEINNIRKRLARDEKLKSFCRLFRVKTKK